MTKVKKQFKLIRKYPYEVIGIYGSQNEIAKAARVSKGTVSRWLSGARSSKEYLVEVILLEENK